MIVSDSSPPRTDIAPPQHLSLAHDRMLREESGISSEVIAERGYYTATTADEAPEEFADYQRKRTGLVFTRYSPDGVTTFHQLRSDNPRTNRDSGKPIRYENPAGCPTILDVHPRNLDALADASDSLWVCEGTKGGDSLTSQGRVAVSLQGVWMGCRKVGAGEYELIPCWDYIALVGRRAYLVFDADAWTNPNVLHALSVLAGLLEDRGAQVFVVTPPPIRGESTGVDDFLGAGGTVEYLEEMAQPFEPEKLQQERIARNTPLRRQLRDLDSIVQAMPRNTIGSYSRRSIMRVLAAEAKPRGKASDEGLRLTISIREIAELTGLSVRAVKKGLDKLADAELGYLRREERPKGEKRNSAATYLLLTGRAEGKQEGRVKGERLSPPTSSNNPCPSTPPCVYPLRAPSRAVPELRWSKVIPSTVRNPKTGKVEKQYDYLKRLGKQRQEIIAYLVEADGMADVAELMETFASPRARKRDFVRRVLSDLADPAVITIEGDLVRLTSGWEWELGKARQQGEEYKDAGYQKERHARDRVRFREWPKQKPADPEEMPRVDDLREHWSRHPDGCACRECSKRFNSVIGEHGEGCKCGACFHARRNGEDRPAPEWVEVAPQENGEPECLSLDLSCECDACLYPTPRYARPAGSAS